MRFVFINQLVFKLYNNSEVSVKVILCMLCVNYIVLYQNNKKRRLSGYCILLPNH